LPVTLVRCVDIIGKVGPLVEPTAITRRVVQLRIQYNFIPITGVSKRGQAPYYIARAVIYGTEHYAAIVANIGFV